MTNLPILDALIYLNIFTFVLVFALLFVFILLYFKIKNTYSDEEKLVANDKSLKKDLSQKIEEIAKKRLDDIFQEATTEVEGEIKKQIQKLIDVSSQKAQEISDSVAEAQKEQVKESQFYVANMLSKIEKDAEVYRKNKLIKVDEEIRQIVVSAAREVIGRAISLSEHEDLVTKALERAKKEKIFS